jgi:hypothetical protein
MNSRRLLDFLFVFSFLCVPPSAVPQHKLLILAPDEFMDELKPLKGFKDCSGRPTLLASLEEIYANPLFNGVDEPEEIKKCIAHYEQTDGVESVLLVGDVDKFPVRWRWWGRWLPNDPYLKGAWAVVNGAYEQSNEQDAKPFCSWVDIGAYDEYTIEADCTPLSGDPTKREVRIFYANADVAGARTRVDFLPTFSRTLRCELQDDKQTHTFSLNQTYHVKIELSLNNIKVWVGTTKVHDVGLSNYTLEGRGKIGLGTYLCHCRFDNFKVTSKTGIALWDDGFDSVPPSGVPTKFTEAPTTDERGWSASDLYYADLYKEGTKTFDDWNGNKSTDGHHEQLYGEIEWDASIEGYCAGCTINNDKIDFLPDVAVGRIPASTEEEVTRYVDKAIRYELGTSPDDTWFKKAITYQGTVGNDSTISEVDAALTARGFSVQNRWWTGDLANYSAGDRPQEVIKGFNGGAGFINYIGGHGDSDCWSCTGFCGSGTAPTQITNSGMLPIVFSTACFTGRFTYTPPLEPYRDISGNSHQGTAKCQRFPGPPDSSQYTPPSPIQAGFHDGIPLDPGCLAEDLLFKFGSPAGSAGAIAYLGERSAGRYGYELAESFYKGYSDPANPRNTLGELWSCMIREYYKKRNLKWYEYASYLVSQSLTWDEGHYFDEPQKIILFGDPSLVIGGVPIAPDVFDDMFPSGELRNDTFGQRTMISSVVQARPYSGPAMIAKLNFDEKNDIDFFEVQLEAEPPDMPECLEPGDPDLVQGHLTIYANSCIPSGPAEVSKELQEFDLKLYNARGGEYNDPANVTKTGGSLTLQCPHQVFPDGKIRFSVQGKSALRNMYKLSLLYRRSVYLIDVPPWVLDPLPYPPLFRVPLPTPAWCSPGSWVYPSNPEIIESVLNRGEPQPLPPEYGIFEWKEAGPFDLYLFTEGGSLEVTLFNWDREVIAASSAEMPLDNALPAEGYAHIHVAELPAGTYILGFGPGDFATEYYWTTSLPPRIMELGFHEGCAFLWNSQPDQLYTVWSCFDLDAGLWNEEITLRSEGPITEWADPAVRSRQKFYKVGVSMNPEMFLGLWVNQSLETQNITRLEIRPEGDELLVHAWGKCHPEDCDWGEEATAVADAYDGTLTIVWDHGFAIEKQELSMFREDYLKLLGHKDYLDDRTDVSYTDFFVRP